MYHCHIHFCLIGPQSGVFEIIKEMSPLDHFTHTFLESDQVDDASVAAADVILANIQNMDAEEALRALSANKKSDTELIVMADKNQISLFGDYLSEITDIWAMPLSDEEVSFRFLRWQKNYKMSKDFWQTSHYLDATINNIPDLVWYKDKDGIHKKVNDSFCKTVNKTKQQVEGRGHAYIWDVEFDDPACIESELEVMTKRETCVAEETIKTGEGTRLLTTYKSPLYDLDGTVMGTVGVATDITQERAFEQEIVQKNKILETIFTTTDCGVITHTIDGSKILSINNAALKILGYKSADDLLADGFNMVAPSVVEEDQASMRESIGSLKNVGDSVSVEYRVRHKDGELLHVMGNVKLMKEHGRLFFQRFLLDCTVQKREQEKKQQENEKRQMELVHALSIDFNFVYFFDLDTGMGTTLRIHYNDAPTSDSIFDRKISMEKSMTEYIEQYVYEEDKEMVKQAFSQDTLIKELSSKDIYYVNYRVFTHGTLKYYQMKAVRMGIWEGHQGAVVGFRNVDAEIRNEMEKQRLLENALAHAKKANEAKSVFLSNMSHDIRTPMNAIVGFTTLATTHIDNREQVAEYLKKIKSSGNHLLNLINDVLDMSHIESGKMHLMEDPCNLSDVLEDLHNILQADVHAKQQTLEIQKVSLTNEDIYCDRLRLNQVLLNLLSNSVKYTQDGGTIRVTLSQKEQTSADYAEYEFHIVDTGIGMSEDFVRHIFEPFERERNSTISGIQGTGLGMAITKNIVDMMGGSIEVKSTQGVGSEFTLSFPFRINPDAQNTREQEEKISKKTLSLQPGRILLAEDVELNQEIAVTILNEAGFTTEVAENGQIALDKVKNSEPGYYQLILMDIQMPVMNGYEATKAIRRLENEELANIPILAMSANAFEEDKQQSLTCGMNAHIAKPIDVKILFDTLGKIIS